MLPIKCENVHDVCNVKLVNQKANQCFIENVYCFIYGKNDLNKIPVSLNSFHCVKFHSTKRMWVFLVTLTFSILKRRKKRKKKHFMITRVFLVTLTLSILEKNDNFWVLFIYSATI
jgi:hypothetical protein